MPMPSMLGCERCGDSEPEFLLVIAQAPNPTNFATKDIHPLCTKCRKSLRRWLKRPQR